MTEILTHAKAVEYRMKGLEAMVRTLAEYDVSGTPALVVIYPGGGWGVLNPDAFDATSELRKEARRSWEDFQSRRR